MTRRKARRLRIQRSAKYRRESVTRYVRDGSLTIVTTARKRSDSQHCYILMTMSMGPMKVVESRFPAGVDRVGSDHWRDHSENTAQTISPK